MALRRDPLTVARSLGHANPALTLKVYAHEFEAARHADEMRQELADGFGHLLEARKVATVTSGRYHRG